MPNTPPFGGFGGFESFNVVGGHSNPQKAHPSVTSNDASFKPGVRPGRSCEKIKYNQDRTRQDRTVLDRTGQQKSHKSVIFHIFGGKLPVKILQ